MGLFGFGSKGNDENAGTPQWSWEPLNEVAVLEEIEKDSFHKPVAIYKHSTRCGISSMMKGRFERALNLAQDQAFLYILDIIRNRTLSDRIASHYDIRHESPQLLILFKGRLVHHASHGDIDARELTRIIEDESQQ